MRQLLAIIVLCVAAFTQTNGFAPTLRHSNTDTRPTSMIMWDGTTLNDRVAAWVTWADATVTPGVTDTNGNTWTSTTACHAGGPGTDSLSQIWYMTANSTGADTLNFSGLSGVTSTWSAGYIEIDPKGLTLAADGSPTCTTTNVAAASLTNNITTTVNGDFLLSVASNHNANNITYAVPPDNFAATCAGCTMGGGGYWRLGGLAGTQSTTFFNNQNSGASPAWSLETIAFKPSAITIVSDALADGANGVAYQSTLKAVGGAGAYTWSNTAGTWPTGCSSSSINAAGVISCTPTSNGTASLTFQVTDGTNTTTRTLNWKTGASFLTPTLVSFGTGYSSTSGGTAVVPAVITSMCPGDTLLVAASSFTGAGGGGIPPTSGASGWFASCGSVTWYRPNPINATTGDNNPNTGSGIAFYIGNVSGSCGSTNVQYTLGPNVPTGRGLIFSVQRIAGVQPTIDDGVGINQGGFSGNPISLTTPNLTTAVANELLIAPATDGNGGSLNSNFVTINSPFSASVPWFCPFNFECQGDWQDQVTTATTYNVTANENSSSSNAENTMAVSLFGLRPALTPSTCTPAVQGDKQRREPY